MIQNKEYGGFVVSKNVINGKAVRYSFREKSQMQQLNGWTIYSIDDDDDYVSNPQNFVILNAESLAKIVPVILEIYSAPYGTDLCWMYKEGVHVGFYDLTDAREISIDEILSKKQ